MSQGGEAAEQIVKIALDGAEVAVKLVGDRTYEISKDLIEKLLKDLKGNQQSKGRQGLKNILKSGEPVKMITLDMDKLKRFTEMAKKYGVPFHVLKDKKDKSGTCTLMIKSTDSPRVNHILQRYGLTRDMSAAIKKKISEKEVPEVSPPEKQDIDAFIEALFSSQKSDKEHTINPTSAKTEKSRTSEPLSKTSDKWDKKKGRVVVRDEINKAKQKAKAASAQMQSPKQPSHHPPHKKPKQKGR